MYSIPGSTYQLEYPHRPPLLYSSVLQRWPFSITNHSAIATTNMGNLALDGADPDPRLSMEEGQVAVPAAIRRKLHDPNIQFEEYLFYAKIQREEERRGLGPEEREQMYYNTPDSEQSGVNDEKSGERTPTKEVVTVSASDAIIAPAEWETASRAARNASWASV